jgi:hypothetical protein
MGGECSKHKEMINVHSFQAGEKPEGNSHLFFFFFWKIRLIREMHINFNSEK